MRRSSHRTSWCRAKPRHMISNGITVGNATGLGASSANPSLSRSPKRWSISPWHSSQSFGSMGTRMNSYHYLIDTLAFSTAVLAQDAGDLRPVFLHGADPNSRDGQQLLGCAGAAGRESPQCAVAEDSERWHATPPGLDQTPDAQRRFQAGVRPGYGFGPRCLPPPRRDRGFRLPVPPRRRGHRVLHDDLHRRPFVHGVAGAREPGLTVRDLLAILLEDRVREVQESRARRGAEHFLE